MNLQTQQGYKRRTSSLMRPYQCYRVDLSTCLGYPPKSQSGVLDVVCAWPAEEGDFVNLQTKHNFTMAHFGLLLGVLKNNLQELQIQHCNDIFCRTHQVSPLLMELSIFLLRIRSCRTF